MRSDQIDELATALSKAQAKMKAAEMDKTNPHFKSKYASLASLQAATRPILAENGLSISQVPQQCDGGIMLETWLMHASGQFLQSEWLVPAGTIQALGSYLTYVKRYAWSSICGIAGDDDDDGNAAETKTKSEKPASAPAPRPAPETVQPTNGNGTGARDARGVMDYIFPLVQSKPDWVAQPASQAQIGFVSSVLEECFAGSGDADKRRRSVLAHLFNVDSAKQLNKSQAAATLTWLVDGKDDGGKPMLRKHATSEAVAVERAYLMQSGQAAMFDAAPTGYPTEGGAA